MKIIGITGTNGSGKDTLSHMLADDYGWLFVSASRDLLIPELKRRGLPLERKNMASLTTAWRKDMGKGVVIDKAVAIFKQESKKQKYEGLVISSLRHPWEVGRLHELGGKLVWVDADPQTRYKRIHSRGHGSKDNKTYEEFLKEEKAEMHHSGDEHTLNMFAVQQMADVLIYNTDEDVEHFKKHAQKALLKLLN